MSKGRPKKDEAKLETAVVEELVKESLAVPEPVDNDPKEALRFRLTELETLKSVMVANGVDTIGKLDNLIAAVRSQL